MKRVLLALSNEANAELLSRELAAQHHVLRLRAAGDLQQPFDLAFFDGPTLDAHFEALLARKSAEPCALPVLLLTRREDVGLATRAMWEVVDDVLLTPLLRVELAARVGWAFKARESSLRAFRRAEGLDDFARAIAHDLRAPLRAMEGFASAVLEDHPTGLPEDVKQNVGRVVQAARRLDGMIERLAEFVRLDASRAASEDVELDAVLVEAVRASAHARSGRPATLSVAPGLPRVKGHFEGLVLVFANLLENALRYCAPGDEPRVFVTAEREGELVVVSVRDHGIGVPPADRERIFRLFTRLHGREAYPGTGVGLTLVRNTVERMGGTVHCAEVDGPGALFQVTLEGAQS